MLQVMAMPTGWKLEGLGDYLGFVLGGGSFTVLQVLKAYKSYTNRGEA